jgi:hypothetical protein
LPENLGRIGEGAEKAEGFVQPPHPGGRREPGAIELAQQRNFPVGQAGTVLPDDSFE